MKMAVITDEIDADLGRALDVMAEYGVRGVELRSVWDKNIAEAPRGYWQRAKDLIDGRGMHVVGIASPFFKCDMPGVETAVDGPAGPLHSASARGLGDQIALLQHCIEAARFFDTNLIRVFSFWKRGPLTPRRSKTRSWTPSPNPPPSPSVRASSWAWRTNTPATLATGAQTARLLAEIDSPCRPRHLGPWQRLHGRRSCRTPWAMPRSSTSSRTST